MALDRTGPPRRPDQPKNTDKNYQKNQEKKKTSGKRSGASRQAKPSGGKEKNGFERVMDLRSTRVRIIFVLFIVMIAWLLINLFKIQVVQSANQSQAQVDQAYTEVEITAQRGNIYDRNMNVLVQDSSAKTVCVIPYYIREGETESLCAELVEKLGVDKDETMKKLTQLEDDEVDVEENVTQETADTIIAAAGDGFSYDQGVLKVVPAEVSDPEKAIKVLMQQLDVSEDYARGKVEQLENAPITIADKVDNLLAEEIKEDQTITDEDGNVYTNGVSLIDDKKRYYTNGNFASQLLGFTGDSHTGLMGVEATYDDLLSGTNGVAIYLRDTDGTTISSESKIIQDAVAGQDLVLTIDSNIQIEAEKQLSSAISQWGAKSGTAIVMNCKTGEVLAMATKPDFNLNDPYTIDSDWMATHADDVAGLSNQEILEQMWRNQAVGLVYEPGSTFKPITVCAALEEGAIDPNMTVTCTGSIKVSGVTINCTGVHGTQTIAQSLENSCNPGLVQIIQSLEPSVFYRYVYDFGFGKATGIDLIGEEEGIINRVSIDEDGDFNMVDYSTYSFGQGLAVTPIQLVAALNCVVNDGMYVVPHINLAGETETPRQVISKKTSDVLKEDLESVVLGSPTVSALTEGYSIGGKSGTAQKFVDGEYSLTKYITSYFSFAPVDDPQYCVLVLLDEPDSSALGSTSAGPASVAILEQVLNYNGIDSTNQVEQTNIVPDLVGQEVDQVKSLLDARGITYEIRQEEGQDGSVILSQSIDAASVYTAGEKLVLTVGDQPVTTDGTVPDFTGMSVQGVNEKVKALGMKLKVEGSGFAVSQSISAGTPAEEGREITVKFE